MKRLLLSIIVLLSLVGCTKYSDDLNALLSQKVDEALTIAADRPNYNHQYYSYYIEPCVGRIRSSEASNIFNYLGTRIILNLNVSGIISSAYYPSELVDDLKLSELQLLANKNGTYIDYFNEEHPYDICLYQVSNGVLTLFHSDTIDLYSISGKYDAVEISKVMMRIARSIKIDRELVISTFSRQQMIYNKKETIQLFQNLAPESGVIEQLFVDVENANNQNVGLYTTGDEIPQDEMMSPSGEDNLAKDE